MAKTPSLAIFATYRRALREEPQLAAYIAAAFVDDVGVALSLWATQWMLTEAFVDQRARAHFMVPILAAFILGALAAGPLADASWAQPTMPLAQWRWRAILWVRGIETVALAAMALGLVGAGRPTMSQILPYFLVSALVKTGLRPTRAAFEVDLLRSERSQIDAQHEPIVDDVGEPLGYKSNLLTLTSVVSAMSAGASLVGLLAGGWLTSLVGGRLWMLFALDALTAIPFVALFGILCRPQAKSARDSAPVTSEWKPLARILVDLRAAIRFLRAPRQRSLLWLLVAALLLEFVSECYDGRMVLRHVLGGSQAQVRHAEVAWSLSSVVVLACMPALSKRIDRLGAAILLAIIADGVFILAAGVATLLHWPRCFVATICIDRALTQAATVLVLLAQNARSRAAIRGRLAALFALVVLVFDIAAEGFATKAASQIGIPTLIVALGMVQVIAIVVIVMVAGQRLWDFGLRPVKAVGSEPERASTGSSSLDRWSGP